MRWYYYFSENCNFIFIGVCVCRVPKKPITTQWNLNVKSFSNGSCFLSKLLIKETTPTLIFDLRELFPYNIKDRTDKSHFYVWYYFFRVVFNFHYIKSIRNTTPIQYCLCNRAFERPTKSAVEKNLNSQFTYNCKCFIFDACSKLYIFFFHIGKTLMHHTNIVSSNFKL